MKRLASFIVKYRLIFFLLFAAATVCAAFGVTKVKVEYDITAYLPANTDTSRALAIMGDEFKSTGTATFMLENVTFDEAEALANDIRATDGVKSLTFAEDERYYKDGYAKLSVMFDGTSSDESARAAYETLLQTLDASGHKFCVPAPLYNDFAEMLAREMLIIIAISAAVIIAVLLFTSKSFAEVIAFPIVFIVAALLNMGTNFWLGTISFVSNTVCIILQLALAIDYAIILCHRFTEEKERLHGTAEQAMTEALAKAIPEISSSSLTTISGLVALMFMQLRLGYDLGMVLAKSIVCSLLTVFLLMPFVLVLLSKAMDKTRHRNLVPKIKFWGAGVIKIRYVLMAVFAALLVTGAALGTKTEYAYSSNSIDTDRPTETRVASERMQSVFGYENMFVVLMPNTVDEPTQRAVLETVKTEPMIDSALGFAAIEIAEGVYITDAITSARFASIAGLGEFTAAMLYSDYALSKGDKWTAEYAVPITDMLNHIVANGGRLGVSGEQLRTATALKSTLDDGRAQLVGERYSRLVCNIAAPTESAETFALIERLKSKVGEVCEDAFFAGSSMSSYDLDASFSSDNIMITLLTVVFIYLILAITFRSWGIPAVLVLVIQGAIFINFALPVLLGNNVFFFTYLIVSAIQMGATIDYAILITNRFRALKKTRNKRDAVIEAVSGAFPTVFTSGTIMSVASFLVGFLTSDPMISSMGMTLGSGTVISIICVMTVLPALLYALDGVLEKTVIKRKLKARDIRMPNPSLPPTAMG